MDPISTHQCVAVTSTTGRRCLQTVGIDADGFCTAHRLVNESERLCRGLLLGSTTRCINNAKERYDYCCAAHDPAFAASYIAPSLFGNSRLRDSVEGQIVKKFKSRDLYHGDKLELNTVGAVELDHIVEKQCFSFAFQQIEFRDGRDEALELAAMMREEVVNELPNLCLTRATTNKIKGAAVWKFLDDTLTGHRTWKAFTDYMLKEKRDDIHLKRAVTRTIREEMGSALRKCQRKLTDEGETPALEAISDQLQGLYVDMELRMPRNGKTKPKAAVIPAVVDADYVLVDAVESQAVGDDAAKSPREPSPQSALNAESKEFVPTIIESAIVTPKEEDASANADK